MRELTFMRDLRCLPLLRDGVTARYEGSIDKTGGNADWDWALYQDERGEWVLFDHQGAGCVYNFVQHRYPDSPEPTFRFYFDGEEEPRFVIRHSQFGEVYPFIEPLAAGISARRRGPGPHPGGAQLRAHALCQKLQNHQRYEAGGLPAGVRRGRLGPRDYSRLYRRPGGGDLSPGRGGLHRAGRSLENERGQRDPL